MPNLMEKQRYTDNNKKRGKNIDIIVPIITTPAAAPFSLCCYSKASCLAGWPLATRFALNLVLTLAQNIYIANCCPAVGGVLRRRPQGAHDRGALSWAFNGRAVELRSIIGRVCLSHRRGYSSFGRYPRSLIDYHVSCSHKAPLATVLYCGLDA